MDEAQPTRTRFMIGTWILVAGTWQTVEVLIGLFRMIGNLFH